VHKVFFGASKGERPIGRPRHRLQDNFKIYFTGVSFEGMNWTNMDHNRNK
jgi:hypothetical protein